MCATCGCDAPGHTRYTEPGQPHHHEHVDDHRHHHEQDERLHAGQKTELEVEQDILYQNNLLAQRNRGYFEGKNILALNLVSSPGSGKTSLLEKTLHDLKDEFKFYVIEGDQQTTNDADRIHAIGIPVVQINTGKGCHLDAHMVLHAVQDMKPRENAILFIENVGNLVCPAMFDLGEKERVVIMSVTEGEDKPVKYPDMFHTSNLCIINKIDLLPYVAFDLAKAKAYARQVNPRLDIIELSCITGQGMPEWYQWLRARICEPVST